MFMGLGRAGVAVRYRVVASRQSSCRCVLAPFLGTLEVPQDRETLEFDLPGHPHPMWWRDLPGVVVGRCLVEQSTRRRGLLRVESVGYPNVPRGTLLTAGSAGLQYTVVEVEENGLLFCEPAPAYPGEPYVLPLLLENIRVKFIVVPSRFDRNLEIDDG